MSDQIFLIVVCACACYTKNWNLACCRAFFVIPLLCVIPEATRNDFDWYTTGIRLGSIHMTTFFAVKKHHKKYNFMSNYHVITLCILNFFTF